MDDVRTFSPEALDEAQRRVIALPADASGTVVGAPGTGKTTTLIARVQALVAAGVAVDDIVVLTPTRATATALRDRLGLSVAQATSGAMAHSIASFAFRVIRAAEVHAGGEPPRLLTGADEDQLVQDLLDGDAQDEASGSRRWPAWLSAEIRGASGFRGEVRAFLAECVALGIEPRALAALADRFEVPEWTAMASFSAEYRQVRAAMRGAHRDAAGLVREAMGLVSAPGPAADAVVGHLQAVLVDDAQELTLGGVGLLEALRRRGIPVLAFGDPDVGSGAFRGATPENFVLLNRVLGPVHVLDAPHRGTAAIVDVCRAVTAHIGTAAGVAHRRAPAGAEPDGSVRAYTLRSPAEQFDVIARLLRERHVRDDVPWSRCAVIAHDTRQVVALEAELAAREVPVQASGPGRPLGARPPVRDLLRMIELAAVDPAEWSGELLTDAMLGLAGGFDPVQLRRLRTALRHAELRAAGERPARQLLLDACRHPVEFDGLDTREARRAARFARTLASLRQGLEAGATAHELLWTAWQGAGVEKSWAQVSAGTGPLAEQATADLDAVVALFQAAKRFEERQDATSGNPMQFVRSVLHSAVAQDRLGESTRAAVAVLTPAAALGAEFDTVVIAGVQDGVWPNTRLRGSLLQTWRLADAMHRGPDDAGAPSVLDRRRAGLHDELRLFVRALSRAEALVAVTAVDDDDTGPSALFEFLPEPSDGSRLAAHPLSLRGLVAAHRRTLTEGRAGGPARAHAAAQLALLADEGVPGAAPSEWYGIAAPTSTAPLHDLSTEDVRVSPSRLEALETCQLDWVIGDLGGDAGSTTAGLGTIIHAALEHADGADESHLWGLVAARLGELEFEAPWVERATAQQARDLVHRLHLYLRRFEAAGGRLVDAEPHFEVPIPIPHAPEHGAVLSGYIDRVELLADGSVVIVDLKTGKSEPQTDTKVADNPQLGAYQLAFLSGAIPGTADAAPGGAKLLVLRPSAKTKDYAEPRQAPFDEAARERFVDRVRDAVDVMCGASFAAPYEQHCRDDHAYGLCRIHTVGAVSAS